MRLDRPYLDEKAAYFASHPGMKDRKKWLFGHNEALRLRIRIRHADRFLCRLKLPLYLSFARYCLVDFLRGRGKKFSGLYAYIGLPGEGKTLSMVAHIERCRASDPGLLVATNFSYLGESMEIRHWLDIVRFANLARRERKCCIIAMDEIHITFDSSDWQHFPPEMLALLSFNRKYRLQFICSSQIYERVPKKIRDICNYVVVCRNVLGMDRLFRNYYYEKNSYDAQFSGKIAKADYIREYVADDAMYAKYDTSRLVDRLTLSAAEEKSRREEAFRLLFGSTVGTDGAEGAGS